DPAPFDPRLDTIGAALTPAANTSAYGAIPASTWNDKIALFLWIIRPDERPLGRAAMVMYRSLGTVDAVLDRMPGGPELRTAIAAVIDATPLHRVHIQ